MHPGHDAPAPPPQPFVSSFPTPWCHNTPSPACFQAASSRPVPHLAPASPAPRPPSQTAAPAIATLQAPCKPVSRGAGCAASAVTAGGAWRPAAPRARFAAPPTPPCTFTSASGGRRPLATPLLFVAISLQANGQQLPAPEPALNRPPSPPHAFAAVRLRLCAACKHNELL